MVHDHYEFMIAELDALRIGLDQLHAERDKLAAELTQARRDMAEMRERLSYHIRLTSERACAGCAS